MATKTEDQKPIRTVTLKKGKAEFTSEFDKAFGFVKEEKPKVIEADTPKEVLAPKIEEQVHSTTTEVI